jgi:predicted ATPase
VPVQGDQLYREETKYKWVHRYETVRSFKGSLSSYLVWLEYSDPPAFEQVRGVLNRIAGGNKTFEIDRKNLRAVVRTASGDTHDLSLLSSGEQNLLILLLELRRRLLPGSIVLIDEIENSLHPAFQHRLAQALLQLQEEVPFQLIATTHAETFVDVFGPKATRVLPVAPLALK